MDSKDNNKSQTPLTEMNASQVRLSMQEYTSDLGATSSSTERSTSRKEEEPVVVASQESKPSSSPSSSLMPSSSIVQQQGPSFSGSGALHNTG